MVYATLKEYVENYQANLDAYLALSDINMKSDFLTDESRKYFYYSKALFKISRSLNYNTLKNETIHGGDEYLLERIDLKVYNEVVSIVDKVKDGISQPPGYYTINVDIEKLEYYQKNVDQILKFIELQINPSNLEFQEHIRYKFPNLTIKSSAGSSKASTAENEKIIEENYKSNIWFKVGLLFAEGKMNKYYNENKKGFKKGYSALKVAKELGDESYEKFILATINNYTSDNPNANKNIFNSTDKMNKIIKHCDQNKIIVDDYFLSKLPLE